MQVRRTAMKKGKKINKSDLQVFPVVLSSKNRKQNLTSPSLKACLQRKVAVKWLLLTHTQSFKSVQALIQSKMAYHSLVKKL